MTAPVDRAFLGCGWAFPVAADSGDVAMAAHDEDIRQSVRIILATNYGERAMRPDFGAGLGDFVFAPVTSTTRGMVRHRVEQALVLWEPRIDQIAVSVRQGRAADRELLIDVDYRVRATNTFYNLVYPFYLLEANTP
jgi:phage baseplate assembly protein W